MQSLDEAIFWRQGPCTRDGDVQAFRMFALRVRSIVNMLEKQGEQGCKELKCADHAVRHLTKLAHDLKDSFRGFIHLWNVTSPTLLNLAEWLECKLDVCADSVGDEETKQTDGRRENCRDHQPGNQVSTIPAAESHVSKPSKVGKWQAYCPYCNSKKHHLNNCADFKLLCKEEKEAWIRANHRCWRCGRSHQASKCTLKAQCKMCKRRHLLVLHEVNARTEATQPQPTADVLYLDRPTYNRKVLLKVTKVIIKNGNRSLEAYAVLDDGSERTILLHAAAEELGLKGRPEDLALRTIRQEIQPVHGASVSFVVSPAAEPKRRFKIQDAFTAEQLGLAEHTQPVEKLQQRYRHLAGLPFSALNNIHPVLLIGSDFPHLITPIEPVRMGPPGGPAAVKTRLGWTLQGPSEYI